MAAGPLRLTRLGWSRKRNEKNDEIVDEFLQDAERYLRHAIPMGRAEQLHVLDGMHLDAATTKLYHRIEKGLTMPSPRQPFGQAIRDNLARSIANAAKHRGPFSQHARDAVEALDAWNEGGRLSDLVAPPGPTEPVLDPATLAAFIESRRSVRNFDERPVDRGLVEEAVRLAGTSPSVCNRQAARAYYFDDPEDVRRIIALHGGSSGFKTAIRGLFVVTYDLRAFVHARERNQGWIDGGLFAMTLILALHGLGLGTVPLNWSRRNEPTDRLRAAAAIPDHDNVVMLIGIGHPAPGYRVARSARRPLSQILRIGMPAD